MDNHIETGDKMIYQFDVVLSCANLATAKIVKAEIKHTLGYDSEIKEVKNGKK